MFIIGLCLTVFTLPMAIIMMRNLSLISEHPYTYRLSNGLSEEDVAIMAILFVVLAIIGIVLMIFGWMKRRNKATLDSIVHAENQNYCSHCNINVSEQEIKCPVCGKPLKMKENKNGSHNN